MLVQFEISVTHLCKRLEALSRDFCLLMSEDVVNKVLKGVLDFVRIDRIVTEP